MYDTLIDANSYDITYDAHYGQGHFYLLGRSYLPGSMNPDEYRYKLFKFGVDEPSGTPPDSKPAFQVNVFPNPTSGNFTISQVDGRHFDQFFLYDAQGRLVFSKELEKQEQSFRLPGLPAGVYSVKLTGKDAFYSDKLVVQP